MKRGRKPGRTPPMTHVKVTCSKSQRRQLHKAALSAQMEFAPWARAILMREALKRLPEEAAKVAEEAAKAAVG